MKKIFRNILMPFFCNSEGRFIPPYFYGFCVIVSFFVSIYIFLKMAISGKYDATILGCVATVIATLAGLYFGIVNQFNKGNENRIRTIPKSPTNDDPGAV